MRQNIPEELRLRPQWVCADLDKIPLTPRTRHRAAVDNPLTWGTYEEAAASGSPYIGFVLTDADPYTLIDLDDKPEKPLTPEQWARHIRILESFDSYTERSASGRGYHIVVRGHVPSGVKRETVEVYSNLRYMICTGNVIRPASITEQQPLLDIMYGEMRSEQSVAVALDETFVGTLDDTALIEMASAAKNGDKFNALCRGDWQAMGYESHSHADNALLAMLAFYTRDNEQVRRIFRMSGLGKRDKARKNDKYVNRTLEKLRGKEVPEVDVSAAVAKALAAPEPTPEPAHIYDSAPPAPLPRVASQAPADPPPGFIGELACYFHSTAVRPVPEIALLSAIALCAGVVGRSYNISGTGLNQYLVLIADTGTGKEGAQHGIERLLAATRAQAPMCDAFIGPAAFASGPGLIRVLDKQPCFMSLLGEFGLTLQRILDRRANTGDRQLRQMMLDLYSKSGWGSVLRPTAYSDQEKNTKTIHAPSVTIFGESTPSNFFGGLEFENIAEGLVPRFHVLEYLGERPSRNRRAGVPPDAGLVARFAQLVTIGLATQQNASCGQVQLNAEALEMLDAYDVACDQRINSGGNDGTRQLWNRAHLKALKLAGLIAVGCNPHVPLVDAQVARWAIDFTDAGTSTLLKRFERGDVGRGEGKQEAELRRVVDEYLSLSKRELNVYGVVHEMQKARVVPFDYLRRRTKMLASFTYDKRGASRALYDLLRDLCSAELLIQLTEKQAFDLFRKRMPLYALGDNW